MKTVKVIVALVLAVVLFGGGMYAGVQVSNWSLLKEDSKYTVVEIKDEIVALSDLTTQEEIIADCETFEQNKQIKGHNLPFTNKKIIVAYEGIIKVATDLEKADVDVNNDGEKPEINVTLQKCAISDIYIVEDKWQYLDSKSGLFNALKPGDDKMLRDSVMDKLQKKAKENDLVGKGNEQAKLAVQHLLNMAYPDAVVNVKVK